MNDNTDNLKELRQAADIVSVISSYLPLTKRGKNYFGVCPFHDDTNPSMSVSQEKQIYKCFSCGESGNVFTFAAKYNDISFHEAVILLGKEKGYDLQDTTSTRTLETIIHKYDSFKAVSGYTDIFIYPGFEFKAVNALITNFHLPKSTLIMLVSALSSKEIILNAYNEAVKDKYRFFSFGDAMFITDDINKDNK